MKVNLNTRVNQLKELVEAKIDDEVILLSIETGKYYSLDPVGSRIWELIKEPVSIGALCDQLMEEYKVDQSTCEKDCMELIEDLLKNKFVETDE